MQFRFVAGLGAGVEFEQCRILEVNMNAPAASTVFVAYPIPDVWQFYHISLA
jgi:hypothetical protein